MTLSTQDFDVVRAIVRERSAIVLEPGKEYLVESRLAPLVRSHGFADLHQLVEAVRRAQHSSLVAEVVEAMTTNETSFFRDIRPFEAMRQGIIPELIAARSAARKLTIWCGACSTGQEPYSVAMMLHEHFPELTTWQVRIIGTDLSTEVLRQATHATYSQMQVNRGVPAPMLVKYFDRNGMEWQVKHDLRRRVEFHPLNLVAPWPTLPTIDLVLLRNVLIYFDNPAREAILRRVHTAMAPDGFLLLGATESTIGLRVPFQRHEIGRTSCLRPAGTSVPTSISTSIPTSIPTSISRPLASGTIPALAGRPTHKELR